MKLYKNLLVTLCFICIMVTSSPADGSEENPRYPLPKRMRGIAKDYPDTSRRDQTYKFVVDMERQRAAVYRKDGYKYTVWDYRTNLRYEMKDGRCRIRDMDTSLSLPFVDPTKDIRVGGIIRDKDDQYVYQKEDIGSITVKVSESDRGKVSIPTHGRLMSPSRKFHYSEVTIIKSSAIAASYFPYTGDCRKF